MHVLVFDTETAVSQGEDCLISLAAKVLDASDKEVERLYVQMRPRFPIRAAGTAVHGVTNEEAAKFPPREEGLAEIQRKLGKYFQDSNCIVTGWNVSFDIDILTAEFAAAGVPFQITATVADLMAVAKKVISAQDIGAYNLNAVSCYRIMRQNGSLSDFFESRASHDAMRDVEITIENFVWLRSLSGLSTDSFFRLALECNILEVFPFGKHKGKSFDEVQRVDKSYVNWLCKQDFIREPKSRDLLHTMTKLGWIK